MSIAVSIVQIILSIALMALVIVQMREAGLGGVFGGSDSSVQRTRRGIEKLLFNLTIVTAILFGLVSLLSVLFPVGA